MSQMRKYLVGIRGSGAIIGSTFLSLFMAAILTILSLFQGKHQKILIKRNSELESYYTSEIAQINGFVRTNLGLDAGISPDANNYYSCSLANSYSTIVGTLANETYSSSAPDFTPYNLKTTSQFDLANTFNQKLVPGKLFYKIDNKP